MWVGVCVGCVQVGGLQVCGVCMWLCVSMCGVRCGGEVSVCGVGVCVGCVWVRVCVWGGMQVCQDESLKPICICLCHCPSKRPK